MAGFFKKVASLVTGSANAFTNKDAASAYVGSMVIAGGIDGDFDEKEQAQTLAMIAANPRMKGFDTRRIFSDWVSTMNTSIFMAKRDFFDLCEKVKEDTRQAEEVIIALYEVIQADGKIDASEREFFEQTLKILNVDVARLGISLPEATA